MTLTEPETDSIDDERRGGRTRMPDGYYLADYQRGEAFHLTPHILRAMAELSESGHGWVNGYPEMNFDGVVLVSKLEPHKEKPAVIGVLTYAIDETVMWVEVAWVHAKHRKLGIYSAMWARACSLGRRAGASQVWSAVHADNQDMREIALAQGRREIYTVYGKAL